MARINDANAVRWLEDEMGPEPDATDLEIHLLEAELGEAEKRVALLRAEIRRLRDGNAYLRAMSSSGCTRGTIKSALRTERNMKPEEEGLL
ncbi:hypothetical protein [Aureimonas psammosilenae]|uniref:hypothetical protein n=1 Tax=Aureimonas psammosilenae TaxID=2495496 RepID=UPI0012612299|nr:hypothetical protein [Aureimonas psammosilenae]